MGCPGPTSLARPPGNLGWLTKRCPQILGRWYIHGIGSNCEWMVQFVAKEMMSCNITSQEEGSFTITTNFMT